MRKFVEFGIHGGRKASVDKRLMIVKVILGDDVRIEIPLQVAREFLRDFQKTVEDAEAEIRKYAAEHPDESYVLDQLWDDPVMGEPFL